MKTYTVLKDFLDRYDNDRHFKPGEDHTPHDQERADLLLSQGFIGPVLEPPEKEETADKEVPEKKERKPRGRKATKDNESDDVSDSDEPGKAE